MTLTFLICCFFFLLLLNVPISFAIGLSTALYMISVLDFFPAVTTVAQRMTNGVNSFCVIGNSLFRFVRSDYGAGWHSATTH